MCMHDAATRQRREGPPWWRAGGGERPPAGARHERNDQHLQLHVRPTLLDVLCVTTAPVADTHVAHNTHHHRLRHTRMHVAAGVQATLTHGACHSCGAVKTREQLMALDC